MDPTDPSRDEPRPVDGPAPDPSGLEALREIRELVERAKRAEPLCDEHGPIPTFPPRELDEHGRLIPLSPEEREARSEAIMRTIHAIRSLPDDDPPDTLERFMRGIDENRPPVQKLYEGYS